MCILPLTVLFWLLVIVNVRVSILSSDCPNEKLT